MPTTQKNAIIEKYTQKFKDAKCVYVAGFEGIDVATVTEVREKFREQNIEYKVLKNRLAKISLKNAGISGLDEYLTGANQNGEVDRLPPAFEAGQYWSDKTTEIAWWRHPLLNEIIHRQRLLLA